MDGIKVVGKEFSQHSKLEGVCTALEAVPQSLCLVFFFVYFGFLEAGLSQRRDLNHDGIVNKKPLCGNLGKTSQHVTTCI